MSASELGEWLKGESSQGAGWSKGDGSGETIGHERYVPPSTPIALSFPFDLSSLDFWGFVSSSIRYFIS